MPLSLIKLFGTCRPASHKGSLLNEDAALHTSPIESFASIDTEETHVPTSTCTEVLRRADIVLEESDIFAHDEDVEAGMGRYLFEMLEGAVEESYNSEDVFLSVSSLSKLLRCSDEKALTLFCELGMPLIHHFFLLVEMNYRVGNTKLLQLCGKIIQRWAALEMKLKNTEVLYLCNGIIRSWASGSPAKYYACLSLRHLSSRAENKIVMIECAGVLDCLFYTISHSFLPDDMRIEAALTIKNLAFCFSDKHSMFTLPKCLESLSIADRDENVEIQTLALEILTRLSVARTATKVEIVQFEGGRLLRRIIEASLDMTKSSSHRANCTHALADLICRETAMTLGKNIELRNALKHISCRGEENTAAASQAAMAVHRLAKYVGASDDCFQSIVDMVLLAASGTCLQVLMWASRAVRELSISIAAGNAIIETKNFLPTIALLCKHPHPSVHHPAVEALETLIVDNEEDAKLIAREEALILVLIDMVLREDHPHDPIARRVATRCLVSLVHYAGKVIGANKNVLVDAMTSLSAFSSSNDADGRLKSSAARALILLAPQL